MALAQVSSPSTSVVWGQDSSVGVATGYGLDGPGDRIPLGAKFVSHVHTGSGAYPAAYTLGTGSFSGVKRPGRGADNPSLLQPRSRRSRAISLPLSGQSEAVMG
jgi:hypothetical protein